MGVKEVIICTNTEVNTSNKSNLYLYRRSKCALIMLNINNYAILILHILLASLLPILNIFLINTYYHVDTELCCE